MVTLSIGLAHLEDNAQSLEAVLRQADERLYRAKQGGRNRLVGQD